MKKGCIFYNSEKEIAKKLYEESMHFFKIKKVEMVSFDRMKEAQFAIVIGGDGTLLRASKKLIENKSIEVIAINTGSLGFLTEIRLEEAFNMYENYLSDNYKTKKRKLLTVNVKEKKYNFLNEIVISKGGVKTKLLRIGVYSNEEYLNTYRADGLIVATPTGSTAYSMSAGGPILAPDLNAMIVTPIAPHNLSARPLVISGDDILEINIEDKGRIGYAILDGDVCAKITDEDIIKVSYCGDYINLVLPNGRSYYSILREKLKWGDNLC